MHGIHDVKVGDQIDVGSVKVTADHIDRFADLTGDRYALHMDDDVAAKLGFRKRVAHGLLVLSLVDGLKNNAPATLDGLVSMGWNWSFDAPVLVGDTIHARLTIVAKRKTTSGRPGILRPRFDVTNQAGKLVQSGLNELLLTI